MLCLHHLFDEDEIFVSRTQCKTCPRNTESTDLIGSEKCIRFGLDLTIWRSAFGIYIYTCRLCFHSCQPFRHWSVLANDNSLLTRPKERSAAFFCEIEFGQKELASFISRQILTQVRPPSRRHTWSLVKQTLDENFDKAEQHSGNAQHSLMEKLSPVTWARVYTAKCSWLFFWHSCAAVKCWCVAFRNWLSFRFVSSTRRIPSLKRQSKSTK